MCEFCLKHGEGKKWYLQAKHYADDLLSDVRRRKLMENFFTDTSALRRDMRRLEWLEKFPRPVRALISRIISARMKRVHYGQVIPIEDIERIFDVVNSVTRIACICRHVILGSEKRYCYGFSLSPDGGQHDKILGGLDKSFLNGPDTAGLEQLDKQEALAMLREHEHEGLCHSVWTFRAPYIGGLCNCDRSDCLAMRCTVTQGVPIMFRTEYVADIDPDACVGCRQCMRLCQFGAISYSASNQKAVIDQRWCYGCGICRSACRKNAIRLRERASVPSAAKRW